MSKILFLYPSMVSFVEKDQIFFESQHEVIKLQYKSLKDLFKIIKNVPKCDIVFSWLIDDMSAYFGVMFSKMFFKKSLMLVGGGDVADMPETNYGGSRSTKRKRRVGYVLKHADKLIAVSKFTKSEAMKVYPREDISVIYHGFDSEKYPMGSEKEPIVITIGGVSKSNLSRKGIELFVKSAKHLPETKFVVIGGFGDGAEHLKKIKTPNVLLTDRVSDEELIDWMQRAKVYVQVSKHEGFGCSMAEAMLCGCIPVVTRTAAIPEVVGDAGYYVKSENPEDVANEIKKALSDNIMGSKSRERIATVYPLDKRKGLILQTITELLHN